MANKRHQKQGPIAAQTKVAAHSLHDNKSAGSKRSYSLSFKLAISLAILSFLVYANTLQNGYVLDDGAAITKNVIVTKGLSAIPQLFSTPYHQGYDPAPDGLYRPLPLVMFAIEYQFFGEAPAVGHFINILLFAGCVTLLFLFLDQLFDRKKTAVAFIAALLFALHPVHTEVVANIKSGDELLCFFFAFLCLNTFIKYTQSGKAGVLLSGAVCFFLSLLSKETSVTFLAVIPLVFFFYKNEDKKRSIYITAATVLAAVVYFALRFAVLNKYQAGNSSNLELMENALVNAPSAASRLATEILMLGYYIKLLFIPYPLLSSYAYNSIPYATFGNVAVLLSLAAYIFLIVSGLYLLIRKTKSPFAFSILFYLATISLFSNLLFLLGAAMAERFVFFASVGFCLVVALLIEQLLLRYKATAGEILKSNKTWMILLPVCLVFVALTFSRNGEWADGYTLFEADVKNSPDDARLLTYLGNELYTSHYEQVQDPVAKRQAIMEAIEHLRKAIAIYPDYKNAQEDIGNVFFLMQQFDSAEVHDKRAIELKTTNVVAYNNLAGIYFNRGNYPQAIEICKKILAMQPGKPEIENNIGTCYMFMKQYDSAICYFRKVIGKGMANQPLYENMAKAFMAKGEMDSVNKYAAFIQNAGPK